jgi:hypothetical protein
MNGSRENMASGAPEKPGRSGRVISLLTARRMLPLVRRIITDVLGCQAGLDVMQPERDRLDRNKRSLSWPQRQRRYHLRDEIARAEQALEGALGELQELGVVLLDPALGRVGFPTVVNDRPAFFSWHPGEETIQSWHFAQEAKCRPIPPSWLTIGDVSVGGKG